MALKKKPKWVVWSIVYWQRNTDSSYKIYCSDKIYFPKYYLDNARSDIELYWIPEEMFYLKKDLHLEANHILMENCDESKKSKSDLVGIRAMLFSKKPEFDSKGWLTREDFKYLVDEKSFLYNTKNKKSCSKF